MKLNISKQAWMTYIDALFLQLCNARQTLFHIPKRLLFHMHIRHCDLLKSTVQSDEVFIGFVQTIILTNNFA